MPNQPKTQGRTVRVDDETWAAVKAEAERKGVSPSDIVRLALRNMLGTAPLVVALLALLVWGGTQADLHESDCRTQWCSDRAAYERAAQRDIIVEQLAARPDCTPTVRLTKTVLVTKAKGRIGDDLGVVFEMPFDQAYAQAKAGQVWVLRFCG